MAQVPVPTFLQAARPASRAIPTFLQGPEAPRFLGRDEDPALAPPQATPEKPSWGAGRWVAAFTPIVGGVWDIYDMVTDENSFWEQLRDHPWLTGLRLGANFLDFMPLWGFKGAIRSLQAGGSLTRWDAVKEIGRHLAIGGFKYKDKLTRAHLKAMRKKGLKTNLLEALITPGGSNIDKILGARIVREGGKESKLWKEMSGVPGTEKDPLRAFKDIPEEEYLDNPFWLSRGENDEIQNIRFWMADEQFASATIKKQESGQWSIHLALGPGGEFKLSGGLHDTERDAKLFLAWLPSSKAAQAEVVEQTFRAGTGRNTTTLGFHKVSEDVLNQVKLERRQLQDKKGMRLSPMESIGYSGIPDQMDELGMYHDALSVKQADTFFRTILHSNDEWSIRDLALFEVLFGTGMRIEEILGLRWSDIKPMNPKLGISPGTLKFKISKKRGRQDSGVAVLRDTAATALQRLFEQRQGLLSAVHPPLAEDVFSQLTRQSDHALDNSFIFFNQRGAKMKASQVTDRRNGLVAKYIKAAVEAGGDEFKGANVTAHTFRRTFATMLDRMGADKTEIWSLLRHAPETKSEMYIRLKSGGMQLNENTVEQVGELLLKSMEEGLVDAEIVRGLGRFIKEEFWTTEEGRAAWLSAADMVLRGGKGIGQQTGRLPYLSETISEVYKTTSKEQQRAYLNKLAHQIEDEIRLHPERHVRGYKEGSGPMWLTRQEMKGLYETIRGMTLRPKIYKGTGGQAVREANLNEVAKWEHNQNIFELDKARDIALLRIFHTTGLRNSSILGISPAERPPWHTGLRWQDVSLDAGTIKVKTKGGGEMTVDLAPEAVDDLRHYRNLLLSYRHPDPVGGQIGSKALKPGEGFSSVSPTRGLLEGAENPVFINHSNGTIFKNKQFRKRLGHYGDIGDEIMLGGPGRHQILGKPAGIHKRGMGQVGTKKLRHTFATELMESLAHLSDKVALSYLRRVLGHVDAEMKRGIRTARTYRHKTKEGQEKAAKYYIAKQQYLENFDSTEDLWAEIDKYINWEAYGSYENFLKDRLYVPERYIILDQMIEAQVKRNKGIPSNQIELPKRGDITLADAEKIQFPDAHAELRRMRQLNIEKELEDLQSADKGLDPLFDEMRARRSDDWGNIISRGKEMEIAPEGPINKLINSEYVKNAVSTLTTSLDKSWPNATRLLRRTIVSMRHHTARWNRDLVDPDGPYADLAFMRNDEVQLGPGRRGGATIWESIDNRPSDFMGHRITIDGIDGQTDWGGSAVSDYVEVSEQVLEVSGILEILKRSRTALQEGTQSTVQLPSGKPLGKAAGQRANLMQVNKHIKDLTETERKLIRKKERAFEAVPISDGRDVELGGFATGSEKKRIANEELEFLEFHGGKGNPVDYYNDGAIFRLLIRGPKALANPPRSAKWIDDEATGAGHRVDTETYLQETGLDEAYEVVVYPNKQVEVHRYEPAFELKRQAVGQHAHPRDFEAQDVQYRLGGQKFHQVLVELDHDPEFLALVGRWRGNMEELPDRILKQVEVSKRIIDARAMASMRGTSVYFEYQFRMAQDIASDYGKMGLRATDPETGMSRATQSKARGHQNYLDDRGYVSSEVRKSDYWRPEDAWILEYTLEKLQRKYGVFAFGQAGRREFRAAAMERWGHHVVPDVEFTLNRELIRDGLYGHVTKFVERLRMKGWSQEQVDGILSDLQRVDDDLINFSPYGKVARGLLKGEGVRRKAPTEAVTGRPGAQAMRRAPQVVRGYQAGGIREGTPLVESQLPPGASAIEGTYKHTERYSNPIRTRDGDIPGRGGAWKESRFTDRYGRERVYRDRGVRRRGNDIDTFEGDVYKPGEIVEERADLHRRYMESEDPVAMGLSPVISYRAWEIIREAWKMNERNKDEVWAMLPQFRSIKWRNKYWTKQASRAYMRKLEEQRVAADPGTFHSPTTAGFEYAERILDFPQEMQARGWVGEGQRQGLKGGIWNVYKSKREGGWLEKTLKYNYARIRAQHAEEGFARLRPREQAARAAQDGRGLAALSQMRAVLGGKGHETWARDTMFIAAHLDNMPNLMRGIRGIYQVAQGDKYKFTPTEKMLVGWTTTLSGGLYRGLLFGRLPTAIAQFGQFINNMAEFGAINTLGGIAAVTRESLKGPGRKAAVESLFGGGERGIYGVLPSWVGMAAGGAVGSMFFGPVGIAVAGALVPASRAIKQAVRAGLPEEFAMRIGVASSAQLVRGKEFTRSTFRLMQMLDETGFSMLDMAETILRGATFMTALDVSYKQGYRHLAAVERAIRGVDLTQFTYDQLSRNPFWRHSLVGTVMAPLSSYPLKQAHFVRRMLTEDASDGAPAGVAMTRYLFFNGLIAGALREGSKAAFGEELVLRDLQGRIEPAIFTDFFGISGGVKAPEGFSSIMSFSPGRTPGPQVVKTFMKWVEEGDNAEWLNLFVKSFVPFGLVVSDLYRFDSRMEENAIRRTEGFWTQITKKGSVGGLVRYTTPVREYGRLFGFVSPQEAEEMDQERRAKDFADNYANTQVIQEFESIIRNAKSPREREELLAKLADTDEGRRKIAMGGIRASELQRYGYSRLRRVFVGLPSEMKNALLAGSRGASGARKAALGMGMTSLEWDSWLKVLKRLMTEESTRRVR